MKISPAEIDALKRTLREKMAELHQSNDDTASSRRPVEVDQTSVGRLSRVDAIQMQAMANAAERIRAQEIDRINATLKRIEDGDFGSCMSCGEPIAPERLAVDPTSPNCIRCATGAER